MKKNNRGISISIELTSAEKQQKYRNSLKFPRSLIIYEFEKLDQREKFITMNKKIMKLHPIDASKEFEYLQTEKL